MSCADSEAPENQALRGKIPDSGNNFLPSFAGLTVHEQLRRADTLLQGPHLRGQSSASGAVAAGSLHVHRCTRNMDSPSLQSGLSPGSAWGGECVVSGEEAQKNPEEGKASPTCTFSPTWKFSLSLPFSLLPVLTLAALFQGAGSDLPEAPGTCHLVLTSVCDQF